MSGLGVTRSLMWQGGGSLCVSHITGLPGVERVLNTFKTAIFKSQGPM